MWFALWSMTNIRKDGKRKYRISSRFYEKARLEIGRKMSETHKGRRRSDETCRKISESHIGNKYALGCKRSEETRRKISESKKRIGQKPSRETIRRMVETRSKPVCQLTKDGTLIREWSGIREAARGLGIADSNISACCRGKCKSAGGYIWRYKD